jgi:membrane protein DedA with SNARE-associated domain
MSPEVITQLILEYRYWILIPFSFIEGPLIAFVAAALAALNYFNIYFLVAFFLVRDIGFDAACYAIGYFHGDKPFARKVLGKLKITEQHLEDVRALWTRRPAVTMFVGKLAYGISAAFILAAGIIKMPFRMFFLYGSIVAVLQYGVLLSLGYFLGVSFGGTVQKIIHNLQYVLALGVLAIIGWLIFTRRLRKEFLEEEQLLNKN